jgi:hypothetical protein
LPKEELRPWWGAAYTVLVPAMLRLSRPSAKQSFACPELHLISCLFPSGAACMVDRTGIEVKPLSLLEPDKMTYFRAGVQRLVQLMTTQYVTRLENTTNHLTFPPRHTQPPLAVCTLTATLTQNISSRVLQNVFQRIWSTSDKKSFSVARLKGHFSQARFNMVSDILSPSPLHRGCCGHAGYNEKRGKE